jgi:hypothetical protein
MTAKAHNHSRRDRARRVGAALASQWLLVLLSHTLATILLMVVSGWLHVPACGG